jgi:hypothetical protein
MFHRCFVSRALDHLDWVITYARLRILDWIYGPEPLTPADEQRERNRDRLRKAFPKVDIDDQHRSWGAGLMRNSLLSVALIAGFFLPLGAIHAQDTSTVTATCKDGTPFTGTKRSGACRGHGGVQLWGTAPAATSPVNAPAAQPGPATSQRAAPAPAGAGQVWVNTASKVYHCPGDRWYGKTKQGSYMSEAAAQAQGARPDHGKACTS